MTDDSDVVLDQHPDAGGTTRERRGAALYDLIVLGWAVGVLAVPVREVAPLLAEGALFSLWLLLVVVEGATGASPGKHVTGLRVRRLDGGRVGLREAVLRRPWGWLLVLQFVGPGPNAVVTALALGSLLVMLVTIERSPDRRGVHDRIAGTVVVAGTFDRRVRLLVVGVTAAVAIAGVVAGAALAPVEVA